MNDRAVELLEQYDVEVFRTRKGRDAILCDTNRGSLIFKEYSGNENRIKVQDLLLKRLSEDGRIQAETILPNKEGELLVRDFEGIPYVLKTWRDGRECNIYDKDECIGAVRQLARLHESLVLPIGTPDIPVAFCPEKEYDKHNRELRRVRKYLRQKDQKTWFEISLNKHFDFFFNQALEVTEEWIQYKATEARVAGKCLENKGEVNFCHGDYQYHNIIRDGSGFFLVNFEKCLCDNPIRDLYLLVRKLLEKGNWSIELGKSLLEAYERERPIDAFSRIDLYYRLAYPEKFWKIANFYYNSGKAWIPGKNHEKLEKLVEQEKDKQHFLEEVFRDVSRLR